MGELELKEFYRPLEDYKLIVGKKFMQEEKNKQKNCIECGTLTYHCLLNKNGVCFDCIVKKTNYSGYWFGDQE